jgi:hypothetical protein
VDDAPTRIADDELRYHAKLVTKIKWAENASREIERIRGACESWAEHLQGTYGLKEGDVVDGDGNIIRHPSS